MPGRIGSLASRERLLARIVAKLLRWSWMVGAFASSVLPGRSRANKDRAIIAIGGSALNIRREDQRVVVDLPCISCGELTDLTVWSAPPGATENRIYAFCQNCRDHKTVLKDHPTSKSFFDHNVPVVLNLACGHRCWKGQEVLVPVFNPEDEAGSRNWQYKAPFCLDCADKIIDKAPDQGAQVFEH